MNSHHNKPLPRLLTPILRRALKNAPVVVLTGARQTGKSTLVRELLNEPARAYHTLDDIDFLERAKAEPRALISQGRAITIDEIQRSPELLLAIKQAVDTDRSAGRFLLTGSANLAMSHKVSETLAGRVVYFTLSPLTCAEQLGLGSAGDWERILSKPNSITGEYPELRKWSDAALKGGFPPAALAEGSQARAQWFDGYVKTYLERDVQAITSIEYLIDFRRLMRMAALRVGKMMNQSDLARDAGLAQATAHRYLNLLEISCILIRLPAYAVNRTKRLIKAPRLFFCDTGLAAHLAGIRSARDLKKSDMSGFLLENLVLSDLMAWKETQTPAPEILYWRTAGGEETDFVVEFGDRVVPMEVKASSQPRLADIQGLKAFLNEYPGTAGHGILLYAGNRVERMTERIWAVPLAAALNGRRKKNATTARVVSRFIE
ncbi:MAG: ATP-binding protein [Lentisphaerae bacterium]|nr:ATP-binding protein [Lentisphaerota bacterium]